MLYGDKVVAEIGHFILEQGHELHAHLHSEWLVRKWNIKGGFHGPAGLNQLNAQLNRHFLQFTAFKYVQLFGSNPVCFRGGGYHFNEHTVDAARVAGFTALSNFNCDRHQEEWAVSEEGINNEPFKWKNGLIEIPVDFSPEPLSFEWEKYEGHFDRACFRKRRKTFNLTLHSWSLLKRSGDHFEQGAPDHEERLHRICEHLTTHTTPMGYAEWLAKPNNAPILTNYNCTSNIVEVPKKERLCTLCGAVFGEQLPNDICPGCGSRARHRQVHDVFSRVGNPFIDCRVLAMYASKVEENVFFSQASEIFNFDVRPAQEADVQMDMQDISLMRSGSFDAFFAMHVLNHVVHDRKALREIHRTLRPDGVAVLTVPYREISSTSNREDLAEHYESEALAQYGVVAYRRYEYEDVLGLFAELFTVHTEVGFDPVTQERMNVFMLRKSVKAQITEMKQPNETCSL